MAAGPVTAATPSSAPTAEPLELGDMQGLIARSYGHLDYAAYLLCRIADPAAARAWLGPLAREVFTAERTKQNETAVNVAISWPGLQRLGLADDALASFSQPMQEGMVQQHRSRILGDSGPNDPSTWYWGGDPSSYIDLLLMVFAPTADALAADLAARREAFAGALTEATTPIESKLMNGHEHFGFADGLSQPFLIGWPRRTKSLNPPAPPTTKFSDVQPGEILLGYQDNFNEPSEGPTVAAGKAANSLPAASWAKGRRDLGRNGTYLVVRQLYQDVPGFQAAVTTASAAWTARGGSLTPDAVGSRIVGRWRSGAPIVLFPDSDPGEVGSNDFGYTAADESGYASCPVGAHIRRGNPRDSSEHFPAQGLKTTLNHRILRRGRPYGLPIVDPPTQPGEEPGAERGLVFVCLNSDIERQFEFVQHTWVNNPYFGGAYGEVDPLIGSQPDGGGVFTVPNEPVRRTVTGVPNFVDLRGGGYFFLPGVKALTYLSQMAG